MKASVLRDDLFVIPEHVNYSFGETLADPSYFKEGKVGTALRPVSKCLEGTYDAIQVGTYYVFSITFGVLLSIWWGVIFALVNFITIWVVHPFIKLLFSLFRCFYICSRACTRMCCDPCFESMAIHYSRIRGGFHVTIDKTAAEKDGVELQAVNVV